MPVQGRPKFSTATNASRLGSVGSAETIRPQMALKAVEEQTLLLRPTASSPALHMPRFLGNGQPHSCSPDGI